MSYKWVKQRRKLTKDQRERGVVFSSALVVPRFEGQDAEEKTIHEVTKDSLDWRDQIDRLKDVEFFKNLARDGNFTVYEITRS